MQRNSKVRMVTIMTTVMLVLCLCSDTVMSYGGVATAAECCPNHTFEAFISANEDEHTRNPLCVLGHKWDKVVVTGTALCGLKPSSHCTNCIIMFYADECSRCGVLGNSRYEHSPGNHTLYYVSGVGYVCTRCHYIVG